MNDLTIHDLDERTLAFLRVRSHALGKPVETVARELLEDLSKLSPVVAGGQAKRITAEECAARERIAGELAQLRKRTLEPFAADSTLVIREMRDNR